MADDNTIRIAVDGAQAETELEALAKEVNALSKELEDLNNNSEATSVEIAGTTKRLDEAKEKFKEATQAVKENNAAQGEGEEKTKSLSDGYVKLGLKVFGAREVLRSLGDAMKSVAIATDSYSGATKDAIDEIGNLASSIASLDLKGASAAVGQLAGQTIAWAEGLHDADIELGNLADRNAAKIFAGILAEQGKLVQGHQEELDVLNRKASALEREIATEQASGEVKKFVRDELAKTIKAYEDMGESVPPLLAKQAADLGLVKEAQDGTSESAAKLEEASVKGAEARAKAEQKAAADIVKALADQSAALAKKTEEDKARLAADLKPQGAVDTSQDPTQLQSTLAGVNQQIADLRGQTNITEDQVNQLQDLERQAHSLSGELSDLNAVFTVTGANFIDRDQAIRGAADALALAADYAKKNEDAGNALTDSLAQQSDGFDSLGSSADDVAGSLGDVATAAGDIGNAAEKGADKAKDGLGKLTEGANEALPLLQQIEAVLGRIVTLGSQADI